ncbi:hypothetical protein D3C85_1250910 [compost metagenome]
MALLDKVCDPTKVVFWGFVGIPLMVYIFISTVTATGGFALTATHFSRRRSAGPAKSKQKALPRRTAPRWGSVFPRYGVHQGASPTVCFATTSSRCVRLRRTALRAYPLMNTSARPAEGAKDQKPKQKRGGLPAGLFVWFVRISL